MTGLLNPKSCENVTKNKSLLVVYLWASWDNCIIYLSSESCFSWGIELFKSKSSPKRADDIKRYTATSACVSVLGTCVSSRVSLLPRPQYLLQGINRFLVFKSCLVFTRLSSLLACLVRVLLCLVGACKICVSTCCELYVVLVCSCEWSDWHACVVLLYCVRRFNETRRSDGY